jgi:hypothetical protein
MLRSVNWWLFTGCSGQPVSPILRGLLGLSRGDRMVVPKHRWITTNLRCVTFRKSKNLICAALEALSDTGTHTLQVFKDISKINSYLWKEGSPSCARKHCLKVRWKSTCWETFVTESRRTGRERRTAGAGFILRMISPNNWHACCDVRVLSRYQYSNNIDWYFHYGAVYCCHLVVLSQMTVLLSLRGWERHGDKQY